MLADKVRVGVDIGGTFTDLVLYESYSRRLWREKVLTTPDAPSRAVIDGIERLLKASGVSAERVDMVIHGTTLVANALIERKGVSVALITTEGFRDVLEIGREMRYDTHDLGIVMPSPLVERDLRFGVRERIGADGLPRQALDTESLAEIIGQIRARGVQSVAVCLLHAYRNDVHERRVRETLEAQIPGVAVSLSSEVVREMGEYERTSTTVANAYVQPLFDRYLGDLSAQLSDLGLPGRLYLMLSDGGTMHPQAAQRYPVRLVQSGPAGGVQAAAMLGRLLGEDRVLCFDMGGTTAKACLIEGSRPLRTTHFEVARVGRFKRGSGLPIRVPVVNMIEIGAGGGSIAGVDRLGFTTVGPHSASAHPGPACYGLGGILPTVTDADLVLGYLSAEGFLGGDMMLDAERALDAIARHVGEPAGLDPVEAAWSIFETVTEAMAQATMIHALEQGKRISDYAMIAIGGAGPVHAVAIAQRLGLRKVICPAGAGVASAYGFLAAPVSFEFVRSAIGPVSPQSIAEALGLVAELEREGRLLLEEAGVRGDAIVPEVRCCARYAGQGFEVEFPVARGVLERQDSLALSADFVAAYEACYGRTEQSGDIEIVTWMVKIRGPDPQFRLPEVEAGAVCAHDRQRLVYCRESRSYRPYQVCDRRQIPRDARLAGPLLIDDRESTLVVLAGWTVRSDLHGNLLIERP
jgi:N-methylhydantoinase A